MDLSALFGLNVDALRTLLEIKESHPELLELEARRERLAAELIDLNNRIERITADDPRAAKHVETLRRLSSAQAKSRDAESTAPRSAPTAPDTHTSALTALATRASELPFGDAAATSGNEKAPKRPRKLRERGALRRRLHELMANENQSHSPADLRDAILEEEPDRNARSLYSAIQQALRNNDEFYKTGKRWRLDQRSRGGQNEVEVAASADRDEQE